MQVDNGLVEAGQTACSRPRNEGRTGKVEELKGNSSCSTRHSAHRALAAAQLVVVPDSVGCKGHMPGHKQAQLHHPEVQVMTTGSF